MLGDGESEAISLALQLGTILLTDDAAARSAALRRGLKVMGTLGILLSARDRGLVSAVHPLALKLREQGFWLAQELIDAIAASEESPAP